ncbi:hypothetical protein FI667_g10567, partial [Globisporangium splendens]
MTVHAGGTQVTFVETYAQPSNDDHDSSNDNNAQTDTNSASDRKASQLLRPSLVIAGDSKALDVVRTVHSPKSSTPRTPRSPSSPTPTTTERRFSFSETLDEVVSQAIAATDAQARTNWRMVWTQKFSQSQWKSKMDFALSVAALVCTIHSYGKFLRWHEERTDIAGFAGLSDPILPFLNAYDLSMPLFFLVYGAIILGCVYGFDKPDLLIEFSQTNTLVMWVRMIALFLTPLEAPHGMIVLVDPIAHADGTIFVRDLFFSGHTATTCLVFLVCRREHWRWKMLFFAIACLTGSMVVVQKTHYTIDVFAAPFFVYTSHGIVQELRRYCDGMYQLPSKPEIVVMDAAKPKQL